MSRPALAEAEITSARPLNDEDRAELEAQIAKLAGGAGARDLCARMRRCWAARWCGSDRRCMTDRCARSCSS